MLDNKKSKFDCEQCLFRNLVCHFIPPEEFELVRRTSQQLHFKKGETIFKQEAKSTHLIFLHKGVVKFNYETETGKNFIMTIVSGPKLLGGANLFFKDTNIFSIIPIEDCDICLIDSRALKSLVINHGKLLLMMLERSTEMFQSSIFNFISLAHKQVNGRIADILIYLSESVYKSPRFNLTLTRKEISEFAACSHENVIITLSRLSKEGIISIEDKQLTIHNMSKLHEISKHG